MICSSPVHNSLIGCVMVTTVICGTVGIHLAKAEEKCQENHLGVFDCQLACFVVSLTVSKLADLPNFWSTAI